MEHLRGVTGQTFAASGLSTFEDNIGELYTTASWLPMQFGAFLKNVIHTQSSKVERELKVTAAGCWSQSQLSAGALNATTVCCFVILKIYTNVFSFFNQFITV